MLVGNNSDNTVDQSNVLYETNTKIWFQYKYSPIQKLYVAMSIPISNKKKQNMFQRSITTFNTRLSITIPYILSLSESDT